MLFKCACIQVHIHIYIHVYVSVWYMSVVACSCIHIRELYMHACLQCCVHVTLTSDVLVSLALSHDHFHEYDYWLP